MVCDYRTVDRKLVCHKKRKELLGANESKFDSE